MLESLIAIDVIFDSSKGTIEITPHRRDDNLISPADALSGDLAGRLDGHFEAANREGKSIVVNSERMSLETQRLLGFS